MTQTASEQKLRLKHLEDIGQKLCPNLELLASAFSGAA